MAGKEALRAQDLLIAVTFGLFAPSSVWAEDRPGEALAALERKLHGVWVGAGPCDGQLTLKADGTFQRRLHGPGGNNSSGAWKVRWDALPPTLVLSCKASDDPAYAGKTLEDKIVQLDDAKLVLNYAKQAPARYTRGKKRSAAETGTKEEGITKEGLLGEWRSVQVTLTGGQSDLELKSDGKFVYEHLDVSLGWRTSVIGTWEVKGGALVLTAQERRHDGTQVAVGKKKTQELSATRRDSEWILSAPKGPELQKVPKRK